MVGFWPDKQGNNRESSMLKNSTITAQKLTAYQLNNS